MFKFIRYFIMGWRTYPHFMGWLECFKSKTPEEYKQMCELDRARGVEPEFKSRFDYALRTARSHYAHRDKYGRKCRKYGGDCDRCNAKHC